MLASLRIRNFALVERLDWDVPAGFVAITGETGAGKSILLGGLKLVLGERTDRSSIRAGATECGVEAEFHLPGESEIPDLLAQAGVEPCDEGQMLIKRTISAIGPGKQFVNGSACTLALLRQIGDRLVDLHGPHDHQSIFSREAQARLLDAFAGAVAAREAYDERRRAWLQLIAEQEAIQADAQATAREIDLLDHQAGEISRAALKAGEEESLVARHRTAANAKRLCELIAQASHLVAGADDSVAAKLSESARLLRELARIDPSLQRLCDLHGEAAEILGDVGRHLESYASKIDADPASLMEIEDRLDVIASLKRKYGSTLAEVMAFGETAARRLAELKARSERGSHLAEAIAKARAEVERTGRALTDARSTAAPSLREQVCAHLRDLGFPKAAFDVQLVPNAEPEAGGCESVAFVFAPNPGEPEKSLRSIASSGEISRVMLALKTCLAAQDQVPVLIFDEIDANVGGEVAHRVGAKMREIGLARQVLCITHLPQVAAGAHAHFVVRKSIEGDRTLSTLVELPPDAREAELARMLGSSTGAAALAHARELLATRK